MQRRVLSVLQDERFRDEVLQARLASSVAPAASAAPHLAIVSAQGMPLSATQEAVVLLQGRPSLLIRQNRFEIPKSGTWAKILSTHREIVETRLPSVGRIEVDDGAGFRHVGTGWVIAEGIIATNRHVAEIFAKKQAKGCAFLVNFMGAAYAARIDFREEYKEKTTAEVNVREVVFMEDAPRNLPDVALLRLVKHGDLPAPIPLLQKPPSAGQDIAVIGYPAFDNRYGLDATEAAKAIFGTIYDVKRLSPGCVMGEKGKYWYFEHDATTLGGNSGSVVLDIATGYAAGMHFQGDFRTANYAIRASALLDLAAQNQVSTLVRKPLPPAPDKPPQAPVEEAVPASYADREGYQEKFLTGDISVPLPKVSKRNAKKVLTFKDPATGKPTTLLKYTHFSVVMNSDRRMCFFSAVNIDGRKSVAIKGSRPAWRADPRIPKDGQLVNDCYGDEDEGKFSRGHMTRREDPLWGPEADKANVDTFHAPNACPQMQPFNAGIWNNLEDYALQNARQDDMRICVFTGPIFTDNDPEYFGVRVPIRFWKVIAFIHDKTGKLCATGYTMSQRDFLPGSEFVFGHFQTYQNSLREIEGLTGLSFGELAKVDPFKIVEEAPPLPLRAVEHIRFR